MENLTLFGPKHKNFKCLLKIEGSLKNILNIKRLTSIPSPLKQYHFHAILIWWHSPFKGTVAWDFLSKVISPKVPNWISDLWSKAVSNIDSNSPRNSTCKVFPRYGPLHQNFLCAMGHYGQFGCAQWAIAADLVKRYGPLRRIWLYAMGHYAEWSRTVKSVLILRYGP
jgi:hypothetical protein